MSELPFELPDAAYAWANLVEATLESALEESSGLARTRQDQWEEPDEPIWSVLVASELIDSADTIRASVEEDPKNRATVE